jgi:hypothetical protein
VTGEIDSADPANSGIQDINLAPRNTWGMVKYVTNIELLKPADMARGNRMRRSLDFADFWCFDTAAHVLY